MIKRTNLKILIGDKKFVMQSMQIGFTQHATYAKAGAFCRLQNPNDDEDETVIAIGLLLEKSKALRKEILNQFDFVFSDYLLKFATFCDRR